MELLQAGVDCSVIALWLGHESVETTQIYLDANLALKEDALKKTSPVNASVGDSSRTTTCCRFCEFECGGIDGAHWGRWRRTRGVYC
jgi:hypothetical protein